HGARVVGIFEQAPVAAMVGFLRGLWRWPSKLRQALMLRSQLLGVPYHWSSVVCAAHGDEALREIEWDGPRGRGRIACEHLAVGYGLVPNLEPARQLGCRLESVGAHAQVWVDARQQTSVPRVFAAGEACGIGGLDAALIEGEIAGRVAAGAYSGLPELQRRRARARAFAAELALRFTLSPRVHALATPDTLVCRCEDVPLGALDGFVDARDARLATRCGMGACQGRVCGAALAELGHAAAFVPRPPLSPVRLDTLATPRRV
ncbi:MAG TPA: FAD-dependent oxidoreductase, partial [Rhodanobacteraceae bacterium]|nr:FAD-dependent oxidoreductase [Rhodanobacteraceae bacterium]